MATRPWLLEPAPMEPATPPPPTSRFWLVVNVAIVVGLLAAGGYAIATNDEAAEVASDGLSGLFMFVSTPFILESTLALSAMVVVGLINQRRLHREGDGWVYLPRDPQPVPADEVKVEPRNGS
jgi:hypothetical protein